MLSLLLTWIMPKYRTLGLLLYLVPPFDLLLGLIVDSILLLKNVRKVALHVAIGARATLRGQPDAVVHRGGFGDLQVTLPPGKMMNISYDLRNSGKRQRYRITDADCFSST